MSQSSFAFPSRLDNFKVMDSNHNTQSVASHFLKFNHFKCFKVNLIGSVNQFGLYLVKITKHYLMQRISQQMKSTIKLSLNIQNFIDGSQMNIQKSHLCHSFQMVIVHLLNYCEVKDIPDVSSNTDVVRGFNSLL